MEKSFRPSILLLILLASIATLLLGLRPRPQGAGAALENARRAGEAGSNLAAAGWLVQAAQELPGRNDLWELAGQHALVGGDPQKAIQAFKRAEASAASAGGLSPASRAALGDALRQIGDLPGAIAAWESLARNGEASPQVMESLYAAYRARGDYPAALTTLEALVLEEPTNAARLYQLGLLQAALHPEAALEPLKQAAAQDGSLAQPCAALRQSIQTAAESGDPAYTLLFAGRALASLPEWELAAEAFRQATLARPEWAEPWAYLGEARQHLPAALDSTSDVQTSTPQPAGSYHAALEDLQRALRLDPASLPANTFLALYWQRQGQYAQAQEVLQSAIRVAPETPALQVELGRLLGQQGDLYAAQDAFAQAIALAPQDPVYFRALAGFSLENHFQINATALPAARRAVVLEPNNPANLDLMGVVLLVQEDHVNAGRFFLRALQADPNYPFAHLHLGMLYLYAGQEAEALRELNLVLSLAPGSPAAEQAQELLQR